MKHYDVAVIGLGMVGASAVYAAAGAGARVLALDAGPPGGGTSGTSFAWLNSVRKEPDVYHRLNAAGMTAHRELSKELGGDAGHHEGGSLEWAESVTLVSETHVPDDVYERVRAQYSEKEIVDLTLAVGMINLWNRIAISLRAVPGLYQPKQSTVAAS